MNKANTVWIVDDDRSIRWVLEKALNQAGIRTEVFDSAESISHELTKSQPDAVISDIRMPGIDGLELLGKLGKDFPGMPVIITTAHSDLDSAVASYQGGAFEYLPKPFDIDDAVAVTKRALSHARERRLQPEPEQPQAAGDAGNHRRSARDAGSISRHRPSFAFEYYGVD
jgi:two-component system, NtrC family, nitrogen regulation response regulator GlnG